MISPSSPHDRNLDPTTTRSHTTTTSWNDCVVEESKQGWNNTIQTHHPISSIPGIDYYKWIQLSPFFSSPRKTWCNDDNDDDDEIEDDEIEDGETFDSQQQILSRLYHMYAERWIPPPIPNQCTQEMGKNEWKKRWWSKFFFSSASSSPSSRSIHSGKNESNEEKELHSHNLDTQRSSLPNLLGIEQVWGHVGICPEAHQLARLWLASSTGKGRQEEEQNHFISICRRGNPTFSPQEGHDVIYAVTGWGEIVELSKCPNESHVSHESSTATSSNTPRLSEPKYPYNRIRYMKTADQQALFHQALGNLSSPLRPSLRLIRSCQINSHCIAISWGFEDGIVVLYRKVLTHDPKSATNEKKYVYTWESVAIITPSESIIEAAMESMSSRLYSAELNSTGKNYENHNKKQRRFFSWGDSTARDHFVNQRVVFESGLLRVSDMVPMHVVDVKTKKEQDRSNYVILSIARLGGFLEFILLPSYLYCDSTVQESDSFAKQMAPISKRRTFASDRHYAEGLPNLSFDAECKITAVSTARYHTDIITISAFRTSVEFGTPWNLNDDHPPLEFILSCSGASSGIRDAAYGPTDASVTSADGECISFWGISLVYCSQEDPQTMHSMSDAFNSNLTVYAAYLDKFVLTDLGLPVSTLANVRGLASNISHFKKRSKEETTNESITCYSLLTSPPIRSLQFIGKTSHHQYESLSSEKLYISVLDVNGGIIILDCSVFMGKAIGAEYAKFGRPSFHLRRNDFMKSLLSLPHAEQVDRFLIHLNRGEIVLFIFSRSESIYRMKISKRMTAKLCSVEPILNQKSTASQRLRIVLVPDLESSNVFCALIQHHSGEIWLGGIQNMDALSLIQSYFKRKQYNDALHVIAALGSNVVNTELRETCYKYLWEENGETSALRMVADNTFFIRAVTNIQQHFQTREEEIDLKIVAELHREALNRARRIETETHETVAFIKNSLLTVKKQLHRLETFLLISDNASESVTNTKNYSLFVQDAFLVHLATLLACQGNVKSLSIVFARHWFELGTNNMRMQIIQRLPLSVDVSLYAHLLPCFDESSSFQWKADVHQRNLVSDVAHDASMVQIKLLEYVANLFEISFCEGASSIDDTHLALVKTNDETKLDLATWFLERAQAISGYIGQMDILIKFCTNSLVRCSAEVGEQSALCSAVLERIRRLRSSAFHVQQLTLAETSTFDVPILTRIKLLSISQFDRLGIYDWLHRIFISSCDTSEVVRIIRSAIMPLDSTVIDSRLNWIIDHGVQTPEASNSFFVTFIEVLKQRCTTSSPGKERESEVLKALALTTAVLKSELPGSPTAQSAIIADSSLVNAILGMVEMVDSAAVLSPPVLASLWKLYECLPNTKYSSMGMSPDDLHMNLMMADLLSRWDVNLSVNPITLQKIQETRKITAKHRDHDKDYLFESVGYIILCRMVDGLISRAVDYTDTSLRKLLLQFLSDLFDLTEVCFDSKFPTPRIFSEIVIVRILECRSFPLLQEIMSMPSTLIDRAVVDSCLFDYVWKVASTANYCQRNSLEEARAIMKTLGLFVPRLVKNEIEKSMHYFDYIAYFTDMFQEGGYATYRDFQATSPLITVLDILDRKATTLLTFTQVSYPFVAHAKNSHTLLLEVNHGSTEKTVPLLPGNNILRLATSLGLTTVRDMLILKSYLVTVAVSENMISTATDLSSSLVSDVKRMLLDVKSCTLGLFDYSVVVADSLSLLMSCNTLIGSSVLKELCTDFYVTNGPDLESIREWKYAGEFLQFSRYTEISKEYHPDSNVDELVKSYQKNVLLSSTTLRCNKAALSISNNLLPTKIIDFSIDKILKRNQFNGRDNMNLFFIDQLLPVGLSLLLEAEDKESSIKFIDVKIFDVESAANKVKKFVAHADEQIVMQLCERGYSAFGARRAALFTSNRSFRSALIWAVEHFQDRNFDEPLLILKDTYTASSRVVDEGFYIIRQHLCYAKEQLQIDTKVREDDIHVIESRPNQTYIVSRSDARTFDSEIANRLRSLGADERRRLAEEGRKLLESAKKAKQRQSTATACHTSYPFEPFNSGNALNNSLISSENATILKSHQTVPLASSRDTENTSTLSTEESKEEQGAGWSFEF